MKNLSLLLIVFSIFSCDSPRQIMDSDAAQREPSERRTSPIAQKINAKVAIDFLNSYIESSQYFEDQYGPVHWANASPLATQNFKNTLEKMLREAFVNDPQVGLGFDPIFDAQDFPMKGFEVYSANYDTGYVTLNSTDWDGFHVLLKLVNQGGKTLVDGCGVVNIPEEDQIPR